MAMQEVLDRGPWIRQKILFEPSPAMGLNDPGPPRNSRTNTFRPEAGSVQSAISFPTLSMFIWTALNFRNLIYHIQKQSAKICIDLIPDSRRR